MRGSSPRMTRSGRLSRRMTVDSESPVLGVGLRHGVKYPMTSQPIRHPVRILGIDPGLRRTGWGVIEVDGNRLVFIGCGSVEPPDTLPLASRLLGIHEGLAAVLAD